MAEKEIALVTREDIAQAVKELDIAAGDIVLVHSSFKSMGHVIGGAEAVIGGILDVIGEGGTLVLPTFCQKDFAHTYETWHMDKESDVGYLTNYFRKREGSYRSDQATHSVAACGAYARELTKNHGHTHKRYGSFGDTPFSADSPWEKMYQNRAKVVLLGVTPLYVTWRHFAEYWYVEECLEKLSDYPEYEEMKGKIASVDTFEKDGAWPWIHYNKLWKRFSVKYPWHTSQCGDAKLVSFCATDFVDVAMDCFRRHDATILKDTPQVDSWLAWWDKFEELTR